jgi:hypothetical protein
MMFAIGTPSTFTRPTGSTVRVPGAIPNEHWSIAPEPTAIATSSALPRRLLRGRLLGRRGGMLLAEGYDTAAIAETLAYSERTIKNVIHDVTSRLHLRNRSHAVAFAMRTGVI